MENVHTVDIFRIIASIFLIIAAIYSFYVNYKQQLVNRQYEELTKVLETKIEEQIKIDVKTDLAAVDENRKQIEKLNQRVANLEKESGVTENQSE